MSELDVSSFPIHLGLGATADRQPEFDGTMEWYMGYGQRTEADGVDGRLVAMHHFNHDWDSWEMHPVGHEVVVVTAGSITLVQEIDGKEVETILKTGEAAINKPGVWHTARCSEPVSVIFITAGQGTQHRPL